MQGSSSRRLAAICFADIVGYTTLSAQDEAAALRLVAIFQDVVRMHQERYGGRIAKFLGDGALIEFSSAKAALQAALALQSNFPVHAAGLDTPPALRIGLHVGEVAVGEDGDLYGDGVNVASRLHGEATAGSVVVSEDVVRLLRQHPEFKFHPAGSRQLKGLTTTIEVYTAESSEVQQGAAGVVSAGTSGGMHSRLRKLARELGRRRVWHTITVYGVTAAAVVQVADTVLPRLGQPEWTVSLVIVLAILGLPIVAVLAWVLGRSLPGIQYQIHVVEHGRGAVGGWVRRVFSRPSRRVVLTVIVVFAIVSMGAAINFFGTQVSQPPFTSSDWLIVSDCDNQTRDSLFDGTLESALTLSLRQSVHVNVLPRPQVRDALLRLSLPARRIDLEAASTVARREGIPVVLSCAIQRVGDRYRMTAALVDPINGAIIKSVHEDTENQDDVLNVLDVLGRQVRKALGESWAERRQADGRQRATTASLAALKNYHAGARAWSSGQYDEAAKLWDLAIKDDSAFAAAHVSLGGFYYFRNNRRDGETHFTRALAFSERVTERERLWIESLVHGWRGQDEEAANVLKVYLAKYPRDVDGWYNLGYNQMSLNRCDEAISSYNQALELNPRMVPAHVNIATCYNRLAQPLQALPYYDKARALAPGRFDAGEINHELGFTYVKLGQFEKADTIFRRRLVGSPPERAGALRSLALLSTYRGRYSAAVENLREAVRLNQVAGNVVSEFRNRTYLVSTYMALGDQANTRAELQRLWALHVNDRIEPYFLSVMGQQLVRSGDARRAEQLVEVISARVNQGNRQDVAARDVLKGELLLAKQDTAGAVAALELAHSFRDDAFTLGPLAQAYWKAGRLDRAAETHELILRRLALGWEGQEYFVQSHYWLARIAEQRRDPAGAVAHLQAFLTQWKDADPGLPILLDARARLSFNKPRT